MIFYDFEVFAHNWLVVLINPITNTEQVIIDDASALLEFYKANQSDIWCGYNSRRYDQYILKAILCGFSPKEVNDFIIKEGRQGWQFSSLLWEFPLANYDVAKGTDRGLKTLEAFMGNDIKETSVPFDIERPLTEAELAQTVAYCRHDVAQTMEVFLERQDDYRVHLGLVKLAGNTQRLFSRSAQSLTAVILEANRREYNDEFAFDFPQTLRLSKYPQVLAWYQNPDNHCYERDGVKTQLQLEIAGVPHQLGYGGLHGALEGYHAKGSFILMDVESLYSSLMIVYNLHSRAMNNSAKFSEIYHERLHYKHLGDPKAEPLKLVLNSTYGVMKDPYNPLYDPLQANRVCIYGQLLMVDLLESLEDYGELIQSNTDGALIRMPDGCDADTWYALIDDLCFEWEVRTGLKLKFEEFVEVFQKDVNNYLLIGANGGVKSKGAYVKKLSKLDYDLPIINRALVEFMVKGTSVEQTINNSTNLKDFQLVGKISGKYSCIMHGDKRLNERCIRIFASLDASDAGVSKIHASTKCSHKLTNSPTHCFIVNDDVNNMTIPAKLDKAWYITLAKSRLQGFGIN